MDNKELFKQAIAEAKTVREMALASAKKSLEESLSPRIQSMIQTKLQEMEDDELDENQIQTLEGQSDETLEEEINLDEILAELEEDNANELDEADKKDDKKEDKKDDKKDSAPKSDKKDDSAPAAPKEEKEELVTDLSVEELISIIKGIISTEMNVGSTDDASLDAGADELDLSGGDDLGLGGDELGGGDDLGLGGDEDEIDLEEMLAELDALDGLEETKDNNSDELEEAVATINQLRSDLNEVNLLNAKLLYVNQIFKSNNLNESQKLKVIDAFDKATNVKEAKLVYESLKSNIVNSKKKSIKESLGFASKAIGTSKNTIVEVNNTISRMQMLAGIKK